jgi:putative FmdB family regulatory protein
LTKNKAVIFTVQICGSSIFIPQCDVLKLERYMPSYDYKCDACGNVFEAFHSMNDKPIETCGKCGSPVRRLFGGSAGIIFKGSGFYVNDYKKGASSSSSKSSSGAGCGGCSASPSCDAKKD